MKKNLLLATILGIFCFNHETSHCMDIFAENIPQVNFQRMGIHGQNMRQINNVFKAMLDIEENLMIGKDTLQLGDIDPYIANKALDLYLDHVVRITGAKTVSSVQATNLMIAMLEKTQSISKLSEDMNQLLSDFKSYKTSFDSIDENKLQEWRRTQNYELDPIEDFIHNFSTKINFGYGSYHDKEYQYKILQIVDSNMPERLKEYKVSTTPLQKFEILKFGFPRDSIPFVIKSDDVERFIEIMAQPSNSDFVDIDISLYDVRFNDSPYNRIQKVRDNLPLSKISLIDLAALHGSEKCFKYLLLNDAMITEKTFINAARGGNLEIIRIMEQTININNATSGFKAAIIHGRYDLANWLLQNYPVEFSVDMIRYANENNIMDSLIQDTTFQEHFSVFNEFINISPNQPSDMLGLLIENGAQVRSHEITILVRDLAGTEYLKAILDSVENPTDFITTESITEAIKKGQRGMPYLDLLIKKGGNINEMNEYGTIPLYCVRDIEMAEFLIQNGVDVNARGKDGRTALFWAIVYGQHQIAELLLQSGAIINEQELLDSYQEIKRYHFEMSQEMKDMLSKYIN